MSDRVAIGLLATGVPGLDEVLGGGLPEFSFNLIVGPPGSGKTTLAHQIMFALATKERPALFFTVLGEPPLKMFRYQQQFAFFDFSRIDESIRFVNLSDDVASAISTGCWRESPRKSRPALRDWCSSIRSARSWWRHDVIRRARSACSSLFSSSGYT